MFKDYQQFQAASEDDGEGSYGNRHAAPDLPNTRFSNHLGSLKELQSHYSNN